MDDHPTTWHNSSEFIDLKKANEVAYLRKSWGFGKDPGFDILINLQINNLILLMDKSFKFSGSTKSLWDFDAEVAVRYFFKLTTGHKA